MNGMTPTQVARALALIKATDAEERAVENLGRLIDAATIAANANAQARDDLTNFLFNPDQLGEAIPLMRRVDADTRNLIRVRYHQLLTEMIAPLMGRPRSVDFHALVRSARPYLLAPYLKLAVNGAFPRLCLDRSDPVRGTLTYVTTSGAADPRLWHAQLAAISSWLGGNWQLTQSTSTTVTLVRRPELPNVIPFNPAWLKRGHLMLGINVETQQPFHLSLDRMTHTLVAGTTGVGKSVFLHGFLRSCLHSIDQFEHIHLVCGQAIAFERYRGVHPKLTVDNETAHLHDLAARLNATMKERTARLVAEGKDKMGEYILLLVDEWGAFNNPEGTDKASKDAHAQFMQNMMHLGKRGRKVGIRLMLVIQEPTERDLSPGIRSTLPSLVSFHLPLVAHATALFGEITPPAVPADPRTLPIGRAIHHDGATSQRTLLHVPNIDPPERRR